MRRQTHDPMPRIAALRLYDRPAWEAAVRRARDRQRRKRLTNGEIAAAMGIDSRTWQRYLRETALSSRDDKDCTLPRHDCHSAPGDGIVSDPAHLDSAVAGDEPVPRLGDHGAADTSVA